MIICGIIGIYGGNNVIKWVKLFSNYYLGFWFLGFILFVVQEIPYMVMPLFKLKTNPIMNMIETSQSLNILEKVLGSLCIVLMIFIVNKDTSFFEIGTDTQKIAFISMIVVLLFNFVGWGIYFIGFQSIGIMMLFIVFLPPLYYIFIGIWRQNWILVYTGIAFLLVHSIHVYGNLTISN